MAKLKSSRMFIENDPESKSGIFLSVPGREFYNSEYEVTMRDCNRQIHWLFLPNKKGIAKAKKVVGFYTALLAELEATMAAKKEKKNG